MKGRKRSATLGRKKSGTGENDFEDEEKKKGKNTTSGGQSRTNSSPNQQQSFLDGTFAGGWQSNNDLPDRRKIIFSIAKVIERMRPDARKSSQK